MSQQAGEDRPQQRLRRNRLGADGLCQDSLQGKEPAMSIPGVLDTVRVQQQGLAGKQSAAVFGGQLDRQRERAQRGQGFTGREYVGPAAAEQIRRRMPAVEGAHLAVPADLQEQYGDELLGDRAARVQCCRRPRRGCSARARSPRCRASARSNRRSTLPSSASSCTASRKLPRTAATVPMAAMPCPRTSPITTRTPCSVAMTSYRSPPTTAPRSADSWAAATRSPSMRCGSGRSSTLCAAPATCRASPNSRRSARRTWSTSPAPTAKKTALVTIRAPSPFCWASGQASLYVIAAAPHTVGSTSERTRRKGCRSTGGATCRSGGRRRLRHPGLAPPPRNLHLRPTSAARSRPVRSRAPQETPALIRIMPMAPQPGPDNTNRTGPERPVRFCRPHAPKGPDRPNLSPEGVK